MNCYINFKKVESISLKDIWILLEGRRVQLNRDFCVPGIEQKIFYYTFVHTISSNETSLQITMLLAQLIPNLYWCYWSNVHTHLWTLRSKNYLSFALTYSPLYWNHVCSYLMLNPLKGKEYIIKLNFVIIFLNQLPLN